MPPVGAAQRHVLVVSDSILLGAQPQVTALFTRAGWSVGFDGAVSRSTAVGADVIRARAGELGDSLVVSLGANDSGNPVTFRQRVEAVMAAAGPVTGVYWLTIREVRPYYGPANQVLRDAAAIHPNLHLIDWNAWSAGRTDLTAADGLHLTSAGAGLMGMVVVGIVSGAVAPGGPPPIGTAASGDAGTSVPAPPPGAPAAPAGPSPDVSATVPPTPAEGVVAAPSTTSAAAEPGRPFDGSVLVAPLGDRPTAEATPPRWDLAAARVRSRESSGSAPVAWLVSLFLLVVGLGAVAAAAVRRRVKLSA